MKIGIIGSGFIARTFVEALASVRDLEVEALLDRRRSPALAETIRTGRLGAARIVPSIGEMVDLVDAILLACPNDARIGAVEAIVERMRDGATLKGLMCDKPLGRTVAESRRLVDLAHEAGLPTAYLENQIFMKAIAAEKAQLAAANRAGGELLLVRSSQEHAGPHEGWFWDPTRSGGGVLNDMGCHSIGVGWWMLLAPGESPSALEPIAVTAEVACLKWGHEPWASQLQERMGVDWTRVPADDYATGVITFRRRDTGRHVKCQFSNSWMYDKQGLRLTMEGLGAGYGFDIDTQFSPLRVFLSDAIHEAVTATGGATGLEKATASSGLLTIHPNELDLYGFPDELADARDAFSAGRDARLDWSFGLEVSRLVIASYMAAEERRTLDLTDPEIRDAVDAYVPRIQRGEGAAVLLP